MYKHRILPALFIMLLILISGCETSLPEVSVPEASVVYDVNGSPIKGLAEENRISIGIEEIPETFKNAIIAVEDKNFYRHHGVDLTGILRAVIINIQKGKLLAGGSTISQQTAKTLFLSNEKTFIRKFRELFYALELERRYSKDEILAMYCNTIYFGHGAYGIEVAARTYFAKSASELTMAECTLLAGLPNAPSYYDPYLYPERARERQKLVVGRLVEEEYISAEEQEDILAQDLSYSSSDYVLGEAPYFIAMVRDYLSKKYGERMVYQGGLKVYTSLDMDMQKAANTAYREGMKDKEQGVQASLVALDVTNGQIRALIGGRDYQTSNYNRVFSERQPGSTFKPFMYSLAIEWGLTPADQMKCEKVEFKLDNGDIYKPTDYGDEPYHWRDFTLKEALMVSDNVVAVRINDLLGPQHVADHAEQFGFANLPSILSLPLGSREVTPLQMAAAYSVFANQGVYNEPVYILKVVDQHGTVLEENRSISRRVVSEQNAYIITDMLKGVMEPGGTGAGLAAATQRITAGKTGTTDNFNDAWFVGYTPQICCAVWVGYDKDRNVNLVGSVAAGPIWANFIRDASVHLPEIDFPRPDNVLTMNICLDTGLIATESCPRTTTMAFIEGTEPEELCYLHLSQMDWFLPDNRRQR